MKNILLIEDDPEIVDLLKIHFKKPEYNLKSTINGLDALEKINEMEFDLIILDVMLPGINGIQVCKELRKRNISSAIMMLTSKGNEVDKVEALETGADDYVTKPFGIKELTARANALIRRVSQYSVHQDDDSNTKIQVNDLLIDCGLKKVSLGAERIELTPKEFDLLLLLAKNPGKTFSRMELLDLIWGYKFSGYEHTVTSHINRLRLKIENDPNNPLYIKTTWGKGYRFTE